ncbi:MAG: hypothetical protein F2789_07715 [Actinobacteria bacterium]|nr:hypothetical protein [Actinomycetota bacterium]
MSKMTSWAVTVKARTAAPPVLAAGSPQSMKPLLRVRFRKVTAIPGAATI